MSQTNSFASWVGREHRVTVPTPSWIAPPLPGMRHDALEAPIRLTVPPAEGDRLYPSSMRPPVDPSPQVILQAPPPGDLAPPPPPYPDLRAEHAALQAELVACVDAMARLRLSILEASEPQLVRLACVIGERIAGHELRIAPEIVVGWAREGIDQLGNDESVVVAVSPDIAHALQEAAWAPLRSATVKIETDPNLGPASCEVRGTPSSIDQSLSSRTAAVTRAVGGGAT